MSWFGYDGVMARNDRRRSALADAGIRVLAEEGARGLTHRAVDATAGAPRGTASNYFPRRDDLIAALVDRIEERLTPEPERLAALAGRTPDRALFMEYLRDIVRRLRADPHVPLALFELRLEASRRPGVAASLSAWQRRSFENDVTFTADAGLPGGRLEIALFHYALDGLLLDQLTVPIDESIAVDTVLEALVDRLLR